MPKPRKRKMQPTSRGKKVLVVIDYDNAFISLMDRFYQEARLDERIEKLYERLKNEVGEIFDNGRGFIFAPGHLNSVQQKVFTTRGLYIITCPKTLQTEQNMPFVNKDTVDETLIQFTTFMLSHPDVGFLCLVSADHHFVPLMEEAKKHGVKRILAPPTLSSLSRTEELINTADINPATGRKMIYRLDEIIL